MKVSLRALFVVSAVYQAGIGLALMLFPRQFGVDAVPPDASPALLAFLRIFSGPLLGIAVLNWRVRGMEPSPARNAVVLANIVGFGCVALMDVWGVSTGGARPLAKPFLVLHLLFTAAFIATWLTSTRRG